MKSHCFGADAQSSFAAISGDCNPIHMDSMAARRTQAGLPVVHGIHTLLWALDHLPGDLASIASVSARFERMLYVGDRAEFVTTRADSKGLRAEVLVDGACVTKVNIKFGEQTAKADLFPGFVAEAMGDAPLNLSIADIADKAGALRPSATPEQVAAAFPRAAKAFDSRRVLALASLSGLVGMVCPGLHSILSSIAINLGEIPADDHALYYRVNLTDERFRLARLSVAGLGISGSVETFVRHPPVEQPLMADLAGTVGPTEFSGSTALVVGGSRGLGELTAKILATGGAHVIVTYARGKSEAERVAENIRSAGAQCDLVQMDVSEPLGGPLAALTSAPSHLYYFATPFIFKGKANVFSPELFRQFCEFYVVGFHRLCSLLSERRPGALSVFYPSTSALEERPANMTEYTMAKAAGEVLCADMNRMPASFRVKTKRLPRLATDQTASVVPVKTESAVELLTLAIRETQSAATNS